MASSLRIRLDYNPPSPGLDPIDEKDIVGWRPPEGVRPFMVKHDDPPYRLGTGSLAFTNETCPEIQSYNPDDNTVNVNDFMTCKLHLYPEWLYAIEHMNNYRILALWASKGYGWCDKDADEVNPYVDEVKYNVIDCGGNRRGSVGRVSKNGINYEIVEMQVFSDGPDPRITYDTRPDLVQVQGCVGKTDDPDVLRWQSPVQGFVKWPNVAPYKFVAYNTRRCDFYPDVPFYAVLYGRKVAVSKYCFNGSKTLVKVTGELSGWYIADETYPPPGLAEPYASRSERDYYRYIQASGWPNGPTPLDPEWTKS